MPPKKSEGDLTSAASTLVRKQKADVARCIEVEVPPALPTNSINGIPATVDVERFAQARSFEINAMESAMKNAMGVASHRVWQTLPRHLRRRAASHDVRRVPVRLREKAKLEIDPVKRGKFIKLLKRKRRHERVSGRTQKFLKRQENKSWLETHLWHAKRMHMLDIWGYRLAQRPTEKSYRPSHRAAVHGSTINDVSYMAVLEVMGNQDTLMFLLKQCCDLASIGPWAARYSSGVRACSTFIYEASQWPRGLIAPATVIWRPKACNSDASIESTPTFTHLSGSSPARVVWIRVHPAARENAIVALKTASQQNSLSDQVEITDLSGDLNSFELVGPRTSQVIHGALKLASSGQKLKKFWQSLANARSPGNFSPGMIIGLTVHDPRLHFPPTNTKVDDIMVVSEARFITPDPELAQSDLWEQVIRDRLRTPTFKKGELDKRRSQNLVPGNRLRPTERDDKIPIILIQHTIIDDHVRITASGDSVQPLYGWTIMLPPSWSMPFLLSLIHTGTRVVGLSARHHQRLESRSPHFPDDYVGVPAYIDMTTERATIERARWERTPKGKQVNFEALGIMHPWLSNWDGLVGNPPSHATVAGLIPTGRAADESSTGKPWLFCLPKLDLFIRDAAENLQDSGVQVFAEQLESHRRRRGLASLDGELAMQLFGRALVNVHVDMLGRGNPKDRAILYGCNSDEEMLRWKAVERHLTNNHVQNAFAISPVSDLPVLGYITSGGFSLQLGHGHGIAAASLKELIRMSRRSINKNELLVRVRDLNSTIAPLAHVTLI